MRVKMSDLDSDEWAGDQHLADTFGVKKPTMMRKINEFEKVDPAHVINIGARLTFVPAFVEFSRWKKKYKNASRKPAFEYKDN